MSKQLQWAIGGLALLIVGFVAFQIYLHIDLKNFKDGINGSPKIETEAPTTPNVVSEEKPEDVPGFKWVRHGDHWNKMPISKPDVLVEHPVVVKPPFPPKTEPKPQPKIKQLYTGPLTYHEELLKTNPAKAFRLQQEERGHWSSQWIPPFPTDDEEAQTYAKARYLFHYYQSIGDTGNPEYEKASSICVSMVDTIMSYPFGARACDLLKLTWPNLREPRVHSISTPSDYFPNYHTEKGLELLKPYMQNLLDHRQTQTDK